MTEELKVIISLEAAKLKSGLKEATKGLDDAKNKAKSFKDSLGSKLSSAMDTIKKKAGQLKTAIGNGLKKAFDVAKKAVVGIGVAAAAGATAIFGMAVKASETADRIDKMSQKVQMSRKGFQEWDHAVSQSGGNIEGLQMGMKKLTDMMDGANQGNALATESFARLGISMDEVANSSPEEMFGKLVTKFNEMPVGAEKAALANDLFGRSATDLAALLNSPVEEVERLKQEAHDLGLVMSDEAVDAGVLFGDTLDNLKDSLKMVAANIGTSFMPVIQGLMDWVIDNMPTIQAVMETVFNVIGEVVKVASDIFSNYILPVIQAVVQFVTDNFPAIQETGEDVFGAVGEALETVGGIIKEVAMPIIKAIVELVKKSWPKIQEIAKVVFETVGGILEKVSRIIKEVVMPIIEMIVDSVKEKWPDILETIRDVMEDVQELIEVVWEIISGFWEEYGDDILKATETVWGIIETVVETAMAVIKEIIEVVTAILSGDWSRAWEGIKKILSSVWDGMKAIVKGALELLKTIISVPLNFIKGIFTGAWDAIKTKTSSIFESLKNTIMKPINWVKEKLKAGIDAIKGFFSFKITWPKIPMPHFGISPAGWKIGDLLKGSIPKLGINWYAKGGVFDEPTLFGGGGALSGLGEAGAEAVVPLERNLEWLDKLAGMLDERMGGRNSAPINLTLELNGTKLGQAVLSSINDLTRQTGHLDLVIPL